MDPHPKVVVERIGGITAVAKLCECSVQAVWQWITDTPERKAAIPKARELYLRAVRPEAFAPATTAGEAAA